MQASMNTPHPPVMKAGHARFEAHCGVMITVATCNDPMRAQLLKSALEAAGIPVFLPNEHSAQTMPHLILAMGGVPLQVPDEHEESARRLIAEFDAAGPADDAFPTTVA